MPFNIIVCGSIGSGKSSLVNMLIREDRAETSNTSGACTTTSTPYPVTLPDMFPCELWDTPGFNEADSTGSTTVNTLIEVYKVTRSRNGVSLLIYCMRGRINSAMINNYNALLAFCEGRVPIALVITGLESEPDKERWWMMNESFFRSAGLRFNDHACIVASKLVHNVHDVHAYHHSYEAICSMIHRLIPRHETPWVAGAQVGAAGRQPKGIFGRARELHDPSRSVLYQGLIINGVTKHAALEATRGVNSSQDDIVTRQGQTQSSSDPGTDMVAISRGITFPTEKPKRANIILFGESGAGKSSLVNMIAGTDCAETSDSASGCTFYSTPYDFDLPGHPLRIWDTAGLNEVADGRVDFHTAVSNIYKLTRSLDGVNLLVYCVRNKITANVIQNYNMFRAFCGGKVPIVLVITAMENCPDEDVWWTKNVSTFQRAGIEVVDHVCVATLRLEGREKDYEVWKTKVQDMITEWYLRTAWVMEKDSWFVLVMTKLVEVFDRPSNRSRQLYEGLISTGHPQKDAREAAHQYDAYCKRAENKQQVQKSR